MHLRLGVLRIAWCSHPHTYLTFIGIRSECGISSHLNFFKYVNHSKTTFYNYKLHLISNGVYQLILSHLWTNIWLEASDSASVQ